MNTGDEMAQQTSITVSGPLGESIRALVDEFPGVNVNRIGRAIVRLGLRQAWREREALIAELRQLDAPWAPATSGLRR